jgi:predicted phosphodiesterase
MNKISIAFFLLVLTSSFAHSQELVPTETEALLECIVTDPDKIPEEDATVLVESTDKTFSQKGKSDIDGKFKLLVPEGKKYTIKVTKFGKDFFFSNIDIPAAEGASEFTQHLRIKLVKFYVRGYTLDNLYFDTNKWDIEKYTIKKTDVTSKETDRNIPKYAIEVWFKRKNDIDLDLFLQSFEQKTKDLAIKKFDLPKKDKNKNLLLEISIPDLHLAKLAWSKETGQDYDIDIASKLYNKTIDNLLSKSPLDRIEKIIFPVGNDFFQFDNENSQTTAGTYVDSDSRWQKMFIRGCELLVENITKLSQIAPVHVLIVPGNHDQLSSQYLGYYIQARFRNNKNIVIDNEPKTRKYFTFGENLLGFTHGKEEKHNDLPLIMATECKESWGKTKYKSIHLGHLHKESVREINGVKVRIIPSLCATDSWHSKKGYCGNIRAAEAFVYDRVNGLESIYYYNL